MATDALLDKDFLQKLDANRHKTLYAKIISLNFDEDPIAEITGNITGGSINVDGSSSVRRSCSLTLVTNSVRINEVDWTLRTKFRAMIGVQNTVDPNYDDVIWFPQGTFVITSFSSTLNDKGYTINISGKDKMCLLNGEVGGQLFAAHEFSTIYTEQKDGTITKTKIPISTIVREAVHTYGQEPYFNIIINDLESCGVELIDYIGDDAKMYIFELKAQDTMDPYTQQITFEGSYIADLWDAEIEAHNGLKQDIYMTIGDSETGYYEYHLLKCIDPNEDPDTTAGYRATDLIYPNDLIVNIGGNITQMLDEIIKMLGEFEYFYDVNGRFIFQRKKIYYNSSWNNAITYENQTYYDSVANSSASVYNFQSGYLVNSFQNKPNIGAIRNDYSVWGKRTSASGDELPIHLREAFDVRPTIYYSLLDRKTYMADFYSFKAISGYKKDDSGNYIYDSIGQPIPEYTIVSGNYDWRELIYQMARDNLAADTKIKAFNYALQEKFYHYSEYKMDKQQDYLHYYKFNTVTEKFEALKEQDKSGLEEEEYEAQPGLAAYEECKENGVYLFGPDMSMAEWYITDSTIEQLENDIRFGVYYIYDEQHDTYEKVTKYDKVIEDYVYGVNDYQTQFLNIYYSADYTIEQKQVLLNDLLELKEREQDLLDYYNRNNVIDDLLHEIDAWSKTFNTGYDAYYADMLQFWPYMYRTTNVIQFVYDEDGNISLDDNGDPIYSSSSIPSKKWKKWCDNGYWNPDLIYWNPQTREITFKNPELLYFWIEFIEQDTDPSLWEYSVPVIGRRSKSINDDKVKAIYFRETPNILFVSSDWDEVKGSEYLGYESITTDQTCIAHINLVPPISNYFRISQQGKSAKEVIDGLIYDGTYYKESITLSCIPIYYFEPNTRITVQDDMTGINGEYLIKSFSIPLAHDGFMSIQATRVVDRID